MLSHCGKKDFLLACLTHPTPSSNHLMGQSLWRNCLHWKTRHASGPPPSPLSPYSSKALWVRTPWSVDGAYVHPQQHRSCSGGAISFGFPDPAEMELFFARQLRTAQNGFVPAGPKDGLELSTTISGSLGDMAEAPQVGCGKYWLDMMRFQYWFVVLGICPATARGNFHAIEG